MSWKRMSTKSGNRKGHAARSGGRASYHLALRVARCLPQCQVLRSCCTAGTSSCLGAMLPLRWGHACSAAAYLHPDFSIQRRAHSLDSCLVGATVRHRGEGRVGVLHHILVTRCRDLLQDVAGWMAVRAALDWKRARCMPSSLL